ncbi:DUF1638 domain-containing protein [Oscillatoria laete-virens NRMC-F 0139]|nr:DUF1638 domain-containing protein [Oscillatoria laete-virens]MDL5053150.1 DUF1638 domain-containing protein [Oscillatoria laete-virens NRMC-F 0139]
MKKFKFICCEVFYREACWVISRSCNQVDVEFLPKGLHDLGCKRMFAELNRVISAVDPNKYEAILLGYGLCNNGLVGATAVQIPLVMPRAHDCITVFMGDKERYLDYFQNHPGTYFKTSGWIERGQSDQMDSQITIQQSTGMASTMAELIEKYGEDNAKFLYEELCQHARNYGQITYIEMGVEPGDQFEKIAKEQAKERDWKFEKIQGDLTLLQRLVDGQWDDSEFLVVRPGEKIAPSFNESVIKAEKAES